MLRDVLLVALGGVLGGAGALEAVRLVRWNEKRKQVKAMGRMMDGLLAAAKRVEAGLPPTPGCDCEVCAEKRGVNAARKN